MIQLRNIKHLEIEPCSVQLVLTDPPYDRASIDLYRELGEFAAKALVPGGYLVAYSGLYFVPEVMRALSGVEGLRYSWMVSLVHKATQRPTQSWRWQHQKWKPILVYRKTPMSPRRRVPDLLYGGGRAKTHHPWEQAVSEAEQLIEWYSEPSDLVADPMCGSGTVLLAAERTGRRWVGSDIDPDALNVARSRLEGVQR